MAKDDDDDAKDFISQVQIRTNLLPFAACPVLLEKISKSEPRRSRRRRLRRKGREGEGRIITRAMKKEREIIYSYQPIFESGRGALPVAATYVL